MTELTFPKPKDLIDSDVDWDALEVAMSAIAIKLRQEIVKKWDFISVSEDILQDMNESTKHALVQEIQSFGWTVRYHSIDNCLDMIIVQA